MKCPYCGFADSKVIDSRPNDPGDSIRRRRECMRCAKRFTTYEQVESSPVFVVKKDGRREPFDKNKLLRGLMKACEKRPVSASDVEALASEIEQAVRNSLAQEIPTARLGEMVMERLYKFDEVAYVRFASVYRQFRDVNSFYKEIQKLLEKNENP